MEITEPFATGLRNYATLFLMPAMQIPQVDLLRNSFYNAYTSDVNRDVEGENLLYCLFRPLSDEIFEHFTNRLEALDVLICDYDYEDGWCVLVLQFPDEYADDYRKVLQSRYSRTSRAFKDCHPPTLTVTSDGVNKEVANKIRSALEKGEIMEEIVQEYFGVDNIEEVAEYWPMFEHGQVSNALNIEDIYEARPGGSRSEGTATKA